jgi:DNA-binding response OmpR family regulator
MPCLAATLYTPFARYSIEFQPVREEKPYPARKGRRIFGQTGPSARPFRPAVLKRFSVGDRAVDLAAHLITYGEVQIRLTRIECKLLWYLGMHINQTIPIQKLVDVLWDRDLKRGSHSLRSVVKNVRRKLEPDPAQPLYLILDRTFGYQLRVG